MDAKAFQQLAESVASDLLSKHLMSALATLTNVLDSVKIPGLRRELTNIQGDYERMLTFMADGSSDPQRPSIHQRLLQKTFRLLQNLRRYYYIDNATDLYSTISRSFINTWKPQFEALLSEGDTSYETQDLRFELVWTSPQLNANEERQMRLFLLATDSLSRHYLLSALGLSLIHYLDIAKVRLLLDYTDAQNDEDRARAIVYILITCKLHGRQLQLFPQVCNHITDLLQHTSIVQQVAQCQHLFSLYQESEQLRKKMEEEILPELIRATQERQRMGFDNDDINSDFLESDPNLSQQMKQRIKASAKEMFQMFQEGADVNLHTFTALKSFPFFRRIGHWLAPFDKNRPEVQGHAQMLQRLHLCDSDLYSIGQLLIHVPEHQRKQMTESIESQTGEGSSLQMPPYPNVIQNLYRLLRRSPWQAQWPDVFDSTLFIDIPVIGPHLTRSPHFLQATAATLYRHGKFQQAQRHLQFLVKLQGANANTLLQLAHCCQEQGNYASALRHLQQAHMLQPDNEQIIFHQQHCLAQLGRYDEQSQLLLELEGRHPDDTRILTETGLCLMQLRMWPEAQKRFYRLEYRGQRVIPSQRAIAWCALRMGDYNVAKRYYDLLLSSTNARWEDYLNMAHTQWLIGDTGKALPLYREYVRRYASSQPQATDMLAPFDEDSEVLRELGKSPTDIALMRDLIIS